MQQLQNDDTILKTLNGTYNINTLNQIEVSDFKLTVSFDNNTKKVSGFSGCNRFFGTYTLNENTLKFSPLASTKMLCPEDKNNMETELLKTFNEADKVFFYKNGFTLFNKKKTLLSASKVDKKISFEYTATSRGSYKQINIKKDTILLSKKRKGNSLKLPCDTLYWQKLIKLSNTINIENISNLTSPSKAFQYDGAPLAHLKITLNGTTYESVPFDHDNPPKEIEPLVKEILSSIENIE
ncbi:hypothetical protein GCM10011368_26200 [Hyunsoonleella pacifica]|nr:hypothetical protein GCM10011368_26200 [Hyunsoonleella pacifica]